jgi:hypothetical protein
MSPTSATAVPIVRSRLPDVDIPDTSVTDYTFRTAPDDTERVAIIDAVDGPVWTRGAVLDQVRRLCNGGRLSASSNEPRSVRSGSAERTSPATLATAA